MQKYNKWRGRKQNDRKKEREKEDIIQKERQKER